MRRALVTGLGSGDTGADKLREGGGERGRKRGEQGGREGGRRTCAHLRVCLECACVGARVLARVRLCACVRACACVWCVRVGVSVCLCGCECAPA